MTLEEATGKNAEDLIVILNTDHRLIESIRSGRAPRSVVEFEAYYRTLSRRNGASVYALVEDARAVGLGMLAYRDYVVNSAQLTFWIGTKYLTEKIADDAFSLLVDEAIKMDLQAVSCVVTDEDGWLIRVWEKFGAVRRDNGYDGHVTMLLRLK